MRYLRCSAWVDDPTVVTAASPVGGEAQCAWQVTEAGAMLARLRLGQPRGCVKERTVAGLAAARARGRTGGRKPKMTPALIDKAQRMYDSRQFSIAEIAASCAVTR